jgi:hypothetical protein
LNDAYKKSINTSATCFFQNTGNGAFKISYLPLFAQFAPVFGMISLDVDNDGNLDLVMTGNDFGNEVTNGRYDSFNGLVVHGDGKGNFIPLTIAQSGIFIPGDGKAIVKLRTNDNSILIAASENKGPLRIFKSKQNNIKWLSPDNQDKYLLITLKTGEIRKEELYWGNSFLSQSSKAISINNSINKIEVVDRKMQKRIFYQSN